MLGALAMILVLLLFIFLGFPIYISTIITAIVFVLIDGNDMMLVMIKMFGGINSMSLMAIPYFILAGNIMTECKITDKLVNFANALVGQFKGGLGHVNIVASMFFGGIQGSGAADASAIGGMLIPAMKKQGYDADYAVAVTAGSSMLSPIIPPSISMILYSYYTELPVADLFMGGLFIGIIIALLQMVVNAVSYRRRGYDIPLVKFSFKHLLKTFVTSIGALIMPLIIIGGILTGVVTATESGVLAVAYGILYGLFVSKKLKLRRLPKVLLDSAVTTAVVMMTIAAAAVLGNVLVRMNFQTEMLDFALNVLQDPYIATIFMMTVLLVLGMFLDTTTMIAMFAGTLLAMGGALGFDAIHFGVLMVIIMQVGAITPPVGTFLYIACGVGKLPIEKSVKPLAPYWIVIIAVTMIALFVPQLVTFLPSIL